MPGLVIKNLPRELHRKLKAQAARHRRSMTKEVLVVLERGLGADGPTVPEPPPFKGRIRLTDKLLARAKREGRA